ncbi:hypothetical protein HBH53_264840, partial [Parastagonospora nodorum]
MTSIQDIQSFTGQPSEIIVISDDDEDSPTTKTAIQRTEDIKVEILGASSDLTGITERRVITSSLHATSSPPTQVNPTLPPPQARVPQHQ